MKERLIYGILSIAFTSVVFGFVFWKLNNSNYTLKNVEIIVKLSATMPDEFDLFYANSTEFDSEKKMSKAIPGSSKIKTLNFNLPDDNNNCVRLDLSKNPNQTNITIHQIVIKSDYRTIKYVGQNITNTFRANKLIKTITVNDDKVNYTFNKVNESYDPILGPVYLQQLLF